MVDQNCYSKQMDKMFRHCKKDSEFKHCGNYPCLASHVLQVGNWQSGKGYPKNFTSLADGSLDEVTALMNNIIAGNELTHRFSRERNYLAVHLIGEEGKVIIGGAPKSRAMKTVSWYLQMFPSDNE